MRFRNLSLLCMLTATFAVPDSANAQFVRAGSKFDLNETKLDRMHAKTSSPRAHKQLRPDANQTVPAPHLVDGKMKQRSLMQQADDALAEDEFDKALQLYRYISRTEPTSVDGPYKEARILWMKNRPAEVRERIGEALKRQPRHSDSLTLLARLYLSAGDKAGATEKLEQAIASNPGNASAHFLMADLLGETGKLKEAYKHFQKVLDIDPKNGLARLNVVAYLASTGDLLEAIKICQDGIVLDPDNSRLHQELGMLNMPLDRFTEAGQCFKLARESDYHDSESYQMLAIASGARNDWVSALDYANVFCDFDPNSVNSIVLAAWSAYASGDILEAKLRLGNAVELRPNDPHILNLFGIVLADLKRFPQSTEQFETALKFDPSNFEAQMNLSMVQLISGKTAEGLELATSVVKSHPNEASANSLLAFAQLLAKDKISATSSAKLALTKDENDVLAHIVIARILTGENKLDAALKELQAAKSRTGGGGAFLQCELANTFLKKGDFAQAAQSAQFALQLSSSNEEAKKVLGRALGKLGNWDGALLYLRENAARNPKDLEAKIELAEALVQKGELDSAQTVYEAAAKIAPDASEPLFGLSRIAASHGDKRLARKLHSQANALRR